MQLTQIKICISAIKFGLLSNAAFLALCKRRQLASLSHSATTEHDAIIYSLLFGLRYNDDGHLRVRCTGRRRQRGAREVPPGCRTSEEGTVVHWLLAPVHDGKVYGHGGRLHPALSRVQEEAAAADRDIPRGHAPADCQVLRPDVFLSTQDERQTCGGVHHCVTEYGGAVVPVLPGHLLLEDARHSHRARWSRKDLQIDESVMVRAK